MAKSKMHRVVFALVGVAILAACSGPATSPSPEDRIRPYAENPFYWQYKGRPVLLLGGTNDDNLFQNPNLVREVDLLKSVGGNYVRNTMSSRDGGNVWAFAQEGITYDLDRWNEEYWRRFETFLAETARREIIVQVEIWATFDYYRDNWERNPFNPKNNRNYSAEESGLPVEVKTHPTRTENDFFRSVPEANHLEVALAYQRRFVEKILSTSLEHDHVLYCMDNETSVTPKWGAYWAAFIREKAAAGGKQVETTDMWDPWDLSDEMHDAVFDHPELYSFLDISQNNHQKGQTHYDNALERRRSLGDRARPLTNTKIYGADTGRFGTARDGVERFWRNIFGGHAAARIHRPESGNGLGELAQQMIRSARELTGAFDLFRSEPSNGLLSDREENEAYCLAVPGSSYVVYFPGPGQVRLETEESGESGGTLSQRWYDIDRGNWLPAEEARSAGSLTLKTPGPGQWAVVVRSLNGSLPSLPASALKDGIKSDSR